jgi:methylthioribose-1-phosphate isomerase
MAISIPAIAAIVGVGLALATCHRQPSKAVQQVQQQAAAATAQVGEDRADAVAADKATQKTVRILISTQEATHAVQTAQGAATLVPADVLARWNDGLRSADAAGNSAGDDPVQPDAAVPKTR